MDDGDLADQVEDMRDLAASLLLAAAFLQNATWCIEPARRDALLNEALVRLTEARIMLEQSAAEADCFDKSLSATRTH